MTNRQSISAHPDRRPYGSRVGIILGEGDAFGFEGDSSLLVSRDIIVTLRPQKQLYGDYEVQKLDALVEGFSTAGEAENAGLKFAASILWVSISMGSPLRLQYHTPLPCAVYDRTQSRRVFASFDALVSRTSGAAGVVKVLDELFSSDISIDRNTLLSMELFASARLESTERAKFINLVSSLEPMAEQQLLGVEVANHTDNMLTALENNTLIPDALKPSLSGRIRDLNRESVSQAIARLIQTRLPDDLGALENVREAYSIRSKLLHEGTIEADLRQKGREIEAVIRRLFAAIIGLQPRAT